MKTMHEETAIPQWTPWQDVDGVNPKCVACQKTFNTNTELIRHNDSIHRITSRDDVFGTCEVCHAPFGTEILLRKHMSKMHSNYPFKGSIQCHIEGCLIYMYDNAYQVNDHFIKYHKGMASPKMSPNKRKKIRKYKLADFKTKADVRMFLKSYRDNGVDEFDCPFEACKSSIRSLASNLGNYTRHLRSKHGVLFDGEKGDKNIAPVLSLESPKSSAPPAASINGFCNICKVTFPNLYRHNISVHRVDSPNDIAALCEVCQGPFGSFNSLRKHMNSVHFDVPFSGSGCCEKCLRYMHQSGLKAHIKSCDGTPPPALDSTGPSETIGENSTNQSSVSFDSIHQSIDSDVPANQNMDEIDELIADEDERPTCAQVYYKSPSSAHACEICRKIFVHKSNKTRHMKNIHGHNDPDSDDPDSDDPGWTSGELPTNQNMEETDNYCNYCEREYSDLSSLKRHIRDVHCDGDVELADDVCEICNAPFSSRKTLKQHLNHIHGTVPLGSMVVEFPVPEHREKLYKFMKHPDFTNLARRDEVPETTEHSCRFCKKSWTVPSRYKRHVKHVHANNDPNIAKFKCFQCAAIFVSSKTRTEHMRYVHGAANVHTCLICGHCFGREARDLKKHLDVAHQMSQAEMYAKFADTRQDTTFETSSGTLGDYNVETVVESDTNFLKHLSLKHDIVPDRSSSVPDSNIDDSDVVELPTCEYCWKKFASSRSKIRHMKLTHGDNDQAVGTFACGHCTARFVHEKKFNSHVRLIHPGVAHDDGILDAAETFILSAEKGSSHVPREQNEIYPLKQLETVQDVQILLREHREAGRSSFTCLYCDKDVPSDGRNLPNYVRHLTRVHQMNIDPNVRDGNHVQCKYCQKTFASTILRHHIKNVHGDNNPDIAKLECQECAAMFVNQYGLSCHQCDVHGHTYTNSVSTPANQEQMEIIENIADEMAENFCSMCEKTVTDISIHLSRIHGNLDADTAVYGCDLCPAVFTKEHYLASHIRDFHQKELTYKCLECSKTFSSYRDMWCHLKRTHNASSHRYQLIQPATSDEPKYSCENCGVDQNTRRQLERHCKIMHHKTSDRHQLESTAIEIRQPITDQSINELNLPAEIRPQRGLDGRYWCSEPGCSRSFQDATGHSAHFISAHWEFRFYCTECGISHTSPETYNRHDCIKTNRNLRAIPYRDFKVNVTLTDRNFAKNPKKVPTPIVSPIKKSRKIACDRCIATFGTEREFKQHLQMVHFQFAQPNVTCNICYIDVATNTALVRHIIECHADHDGTQPMECPQCHKMNIPECRIALHLKYCNKIDSETGRIYQETSSSGFDEDERSLRSLGEPSTSRKAIAYCPEQPYVESAESDNAESSDDLPEMEELPQLEIQTL